MSAAALVAVLLSAVLHASWNALLKRAADAPATAAWFVGGAAMISGVGGLLRADGIPHAAWTATLGSGLVEAAYFVTLGAALTRLPLGTAYAVARGGGQLLTWPIAVWWLAEQPTSPAIVGALLVTLGLAATARAGRPDPGGLLWAFACAVTIGAYPVTYKAALAAGAEEAALFATSLAVSLPLQIAALGPGRRRRLSDAWNDGRSAIILGSALCAASFLAFLVALDLGGAGRASALRNVSVLVAAALGWWSGEPTGRRTAFAAVAIAGGAALVAWR